MNTEQLKGIMNFLPENLKGKATQALNKALEIIDPTQIKTKEDAVKAFQQINNTLGFPPDLMTKVNNYLNNPLATPIMGALGINKQDFKNGLQSIIQPDNTSALTKNNSSLLQGIDQL